MVNKPEQDEMKSFIETTIRLRQCATEHLDKILNTGIANSLKLLQVEASLRTQSSAVKQLTSRQEETADATQQSLFELKRKLEEMKIICDVMMKAVDSQSRSDSMVPELNVRIKILSTFFYKLIPVYYFFLLISVHRSSHQERRPCRHLLKS